MGLRNRCGRPHRSGGVDVPRCREAERSLPTDGDRLGGFLAEHVRSPDWADPKLLVSITSSPAVDAGVASHAIPGEFSSAQSLPTRSVATPRRPFARTRTL